MLFSLRTDPQNPPSSVPEIYPPTDAAGDFFSYPESMESIRILIVDDQPQVRQSLAALLELAASRTRPTIELVGEAKDGQEALLLACKLHPDVVLMDMEMPGMDGLEVTRRIKQLLPTTRVIILTIYSGSEAQRCAREAGADDFIVKGASFRTLLNAILGRSDSSNPFEPMKGDML